MRQIFRTPCFKVEGGIGPTGTIIEICRSLFETSGQQRQDKDCLNSAKKNKQKQNKTKTKQNKTKQKEKGDGGRGSQKWRLQPDVLVIILRNSPKTSNWMSFLAVFRGKQNEKGSSHYWLVSVSNLHLVDFLWSHVKKLISPRKVNNLKLKWKSK